jgi:hypothetical protein
MSIISSLSFAISNQSAVSTKNSMQLTGNVQNSMQLTGNVHSFTVERNREGGDPVKIKIEQAGIDVFLSIMEGGNFQFKAPCTLQGTNPRKVVCLLS